MGDVIRLNVLIMHGLHLVEKKDGIKQVNIDTIKLQFILHSWLHLDRLGGKIKI